MRSVLFPLVLLAACAGSEVLVEPEQSIPVSASSVNAGQTASVWIPVDFIYGDPSGCLGEEVQLTGYHHIQAHRTTLPNGNMREHYTFGYKVDAVGLTSGERYQYQNDYPASFDWIGKDAGDHATYTYMIQIRGNGHIVKEHITYLYTWNGSGELVVDKVKVLWQCE